MTIDELTSLGGRYRASGRRRWRHGEARARRWTMFVERGWWIAGGDVVGARGRHLHDRRIRRATWAGYMGEGYYAPRRFIAGQDDHTGVNDRKLRLEAFYTARRLYLPMGGTAPWFERTHGPQCLCGHCEAIGLWVLTREG